MHYPNYGRVLTFREGNYLVRYDIDCTKLMYHGNTFQLADQVSLRNWLAILRSLPKPLEICRRFSNALMLFKEGTFYSLCKRICPAYQRKPWIE